MPHKLVAAARASMAVSALAGPGANDEWLRLRALADVRAFLALLRPARQARVLDDIAETIDRYAQQRAIGLNGRISPLATRDEAALAVHPEMRAQAEAAAVHVERPPPLAESIFRLMKQS